MPRKHLGKLRPRYRFALHPFREVRWGRCPRCRKLMHPRKFPLLIHVEGAGLVVLGKTCQYCTPCEFIIAHREEVETQLTILFEEKRPEVVGNEYLVVGTVERDTWRGSLTDPIGVAELLEHTADIKYPMILHDP